MMRSKGLIRPMREDAAGDAALLVLVDSSGPYWDYAIVEETVLAALEHFGMPYRVLDLSDRRATPEALTGCAAVVLAQAGLGARLTSEEQSAVADAVESGVGLVNFDSDLRLYGPPLLEVFGFDRVNPHAYVTDTIRIRQSAHHITAMQEPGEFHSFDRMVTAVVVGQWRSDVAALAEGVLGKEQLIHIRHLAPWSAFEPRNHALLFAARWGRGRAVQFALSPRVWRREFFGHARGIDDLFWRSIVWAARKPFAANMVPPMAVMSFDDCSGRHDFAYVDLAVRHGWTPTPALFLKTVPKRLFPKIRAGLESGQASYCTHALDYYELLSYEFGRGECTLDKLKENFAFEEAWWREVGAQQGETVRIHWGEYGVNALPFYKRSGRTFFCPALQTGLHKADTCMADGFRPYGLQNCYYDYLPDDHDLFGFAAFLARGQEDFQSGCTASLRESEGNDVEKAARSGARRVQHGLRAGFFAEILTHEQKFEVLTMEDWDQILKRIDELTADVEMVRVTHDEIAHYLRGKDGVHISEATVEGDRVRCALRGRTDTALRLSEFTDEDDGVRRQYRQVDPFEGEGTVG